ncbi:MULTISPECIES: hypothetical protein [unclassified Streptococcus]|uniref:hypothetical protein n=1 Tax=unclassified Streptococcus TaxID=2608887 RepID=UPI0010728D94|nr:MULTISPECIES: hypothetical protein [unclassified Streptococcus]MBF0786533.1 hypothetical protein [Streptococcus sp. 19428wC2_LYSM12]MCQ9212311.1 hypothetical protein [Streptococcus sp. B01]MCQ9213642.1 hypothetical protein [Streptococcus sp. O1]TFV06695.1 hypothetical protein E4T79_01120 [Streptococcus sp. LYSM12]
MRNYIARVLVEHQFTPKREDYSSFSELIILGKFDLPANLEFSQLFFDEEIDIINQLFILISQKVNDEYDNANGGRVSLVVKEISKIEDIGLEFFATSDIYELDERLYTFNELMTFDDFKKKYYFGQFSD